MQHTPLEFHPCDGLTVRLQRSNDNLDSASTAARGLDIGFRAKLALVVRDASSDAAHSGKIRL